VVKEKGSHACTSYLEGKIATKFVAIFKFPPHTKTKEQKTITITTSECTLLERTCNLIEPKQICRKS